MADKMTVLIMTAREIDREDFWCWADEIIMGYKDSPGKRLSRKDFQDLLEKGQFQFTDDFGYTKAVTKYMLVKR